MECRRSVSGWAATVWRAEPRSSGTTASAAAGFTALAAGTGQIGAGLFLASGLLTPAAAMVAVGVMTVAGTVKWHNGLWVQNDGYEYPMVLVVASAVLALTGPGRWSADSLLGLTPWPLWICLATIGIGLASGLLTRVVLHRPPAPGERTPHVQAVD